MALTIVKKKKFAQYKIKTESIIIYSITTFQGKY